MPIPVQCPKCGKSLQAPDSSEGKRAKCPKCSTVLQIPKPVKKAEELTSGFDGFDSAPAPRRDLSDLLDEEYPLASSPSPAAAPSPPADDRRPCPMCGEMIVSTAAKCRYCGEVFDSTLKRATKKKKAHSDEDTNLSGGEIALAVICSGIACILSVIWLIQGKPKAWKMMGISILAQIGWGVLRVVIEVMNNAPGP